MGVRAIKIAPYAKKCAGGENAFCGGKQMSAFCRLKGIEIRKCADDGGQYGEVNSYPMAVWDEFMGNSARKR